jgi:hypothetical protein
MLSLASPLLYSDVVLRSLPVSQHSFAERLKQRPDWDSASHVKTSFHPDLRCRSVEGDQLLYAAHVRSLTIIVDDNFCCDLCLREGLKDVFGLIGEANIARAGQIGGLNRLRLCCPSLDPSAVPLLTAELVKLLVGSALKDVAVAKVVPDTSIPDIRTDEDFDRWLLDNDTTDIEYEKDEGSVAYRTDVDRSVMAMDPGSMSQAAVNSGAPPITHLLISGGWRYPALADLLSQIAPTLQQLVLPNIIPSPTNPISFAALTAPFPALLSLSLVLPNSTSLAAPLLVGIPHLLSLCPSLTTLRIKHRTPKRSMLSHVPVPDGAWGSWTEDTFPSPAWLVKKGVGERLDVGMELLAGVRSRAVGKLELELPSLNGPLVGMLLGLSPQELAANEAADGVTTVDSLPLFPRLRSLLLSGGGPGSSVGLSSRSIRTLCGHWKLAAQLEHFVMVNLDIDSSALTYIRDGLVNLNRLEVWCVGGFRLWNFGVFADGIGGEKPRQLLLRSELQPADGTRQNFLLHSERLLERAGWDFEVAVGKNFDPVAVLV